MHRFLWLCAVGAASLCGGAYAEPRPADPDADPDAADLQSSADASAWSELRRATGDVDALECLRILAPLTWHPSELSSDVADEVNEALAACRKQLVARYKPIKHGGCRLKIAGAIATAAAPRAMVPSGAKAACVALVPGTPDPTATAPADPSLGEPCPRVELVWSTGKLRRRALAVDDGGPLTDPAWCCALDSIAAGVLDGQARVKVSGTSHACGGTAYQDSAGLYSWNGTSLASPLDLSIAYH